MIKEAYVSFEVAKLLKEKGFNDEVRAYYLLDNETKEDELIHDDRLDTPNQWSGDYYSAPTHQMAMAWFRSVHNLCISIYYLFPYGYTIDILYTDKDTHFKEFRKIRNNVYDSYEEAVEAALKYCLENLI